MLKKKTTKNKVKKKCSTCYGFGLWAIGTPCPMGPMDFGNGYSTKICPECGAGKRLPTWTTAKGLVIPVKELTDDHLKNIVLHLDERKEGKTKVRRMIEKEVKRRKK